MFNPAVTLINGEMRSGETLAALFIKDQINGGDRRAALCLQRGVSRCWWWRSCRFIKHQICLIRTEPEREMETRWRRKTWLTKRQNGRGLHDEHGEVTADIPTVATFEALSMRRLVSLSMLTDVTGRLLRGNEWISSGFHRFPDNMNLSADHKTRLLNGNTFKFSFCFQTGPLYKCENEVKLISPHELLHRWN